MIAGRWWGRASHVGAAGRLAAAFLVTGVVVVGGPTGVVRPLAASAQEQTLSEDNGPWSDGASSDDWSDDSVAADGSGDIAATVDQAIADVWSDTGEAGTAEAAPDSAVAAEPTYDANGNLIDPYTGAPLAIGPDGTPIDAAAGLYFDEAGNLIDPATGLAVSVAGGDQAAPADDAAAATDADGAAVESGEAVPELVTTPWLAPPPSGPPPGFASWSPPRTVYIPDSGHSIDGVFLDTWRAWGGATSWGLPVTAELEENGRTVQYYDFGRFEYHPDDPNGSVVQFGDLGRQLQPFIVRRASGSGSQAANETALAARAWAPVADDEGRPSSTNWRYVPESGHVVGGSFKSFWEATGEATYLGNPLSEAYKLDGVTYQVFQRGALAQRPGGSPYLVPVGKLMVERLRLDTAPTGQGDLPIYSESLFVPPPPVTVSGIPADPNGEKWVQVSISMQYLWAYQGDQVLWQGYISTGTARFQTPTGQFHVLSKLPSQTMEGVLGGEYYNVPDVPDVMYFTDFGHAIHGTYWHNSFGTPMSHGCVNLPMDVADWMYQWAPVGMRVDIVP